MQRRFTNITIIALLATTAVLTSCGKKYSKDDPLPPSYNPSIFISSDNQFVYALDPENGYKHWEYNVGGAVQASMLLYNENLYVPTVNGILYKLNAKTGALLTQFNFHTQLYATPVTDGSGLYYVAGNNDTLYAMDIKADTIRWKYGTHGPIVSSPTINNGQVIFGSYDGKVYSIDKTTGATNWTYTSNPLDSFYSSPAVGGNTFVYIGGNSGNMYSLHLSDGTLRWKYLTKGSVQSSPTAYGGNVMFGSSDYNFYCVDTASGLPRWVDSTGDRIISSPVAQNQVIFVGGYDYNVYAFNILDGSKKWSVPTGGLIKSSPVLYNGTLYIGGYDKYLYAIDTASGNVKWKQNINGVIECSPLVDDLSGNSYNSSISGLSN